jgi:WD40 repeat protein
LALAFSPDGAWLVCGGNFDHELVIWDVATGRVRDRIRGAGNSVRSLVVSPDGTRIASGSFEGGTECVMSVADVATGRTVATGRGLPYSFSPDGKWLAGRDADLTSVALWDARDFHLAASWPGHEASINAGSYRPDGGRHLSASSDHTVRVWDPSTGDCLRVFRGHSDEVFTAVFHPDGTRVASAGRDRAIVLWDAASDQGGVRLHGHLSFVWSLAFSPDGKSLVSGSGDTNVRLWDTEPLRERYLARRAAEALRPAADALVTRLFRETNQDVARVMAAVRADQSLSEPQRTAAFRAVLRMSQSAASHPRP